MTKKIQSIFLFSLLLISSSLSSAELNKSLFIGSNIGYIYDAKSFKGDVETDFDVKSSALSYSIELGYRYDKTFFYSITHARADFKTHKYDNLYLSANYNFDLKSSGFSPYIGVIGGWSRLTWTEHPVEASLESETKSSNYLVGLELGVEHRVADKFTLYGSYIYNYSPQKTFLHDDGEISYDNTHNFVLGFRYYFYVKENGEQL